MEPTLSPKDHINQLYTERAGNRLWCEDAFDTGVLAQGMLGGGRFFNELLQNTDDAKSKWIWCWHSGQQLIFTHAGKHFTKNDVEKISGFARQRFSEKSEDPTQTGYKGIGAKSLTAIAETIYIFSAGYTFRFDERHWEGQTMPWHRIPIWTELEEAPQNLQAHLQAHKEYVNIVLILKPTAAVGEQLEAFCQQTRPSLFLRSIKSITISKSEQKLTFNIVDNPTDIWPRKRTVNGDYRQPDWMVDCITLRIDQTQRDFIKDLNPTLCPAHLKTAPVINMFFAFPMQGEQLITGTEMELFNNLPTKVRLSLPFAVDTQFLLEAQRDQLVDNGWNYFIVQHIAYFHFCSLAKLASGSLWQSILSGLGPTSLPQADQNLVKSYEFGFQGGASQFPCIPSFTPTRTLLTLNACCVDTTGFYSTFKDDLPPATIPPDLAHPELLDYQKLGSYPIKKCLDFNDILGNLKGIFQHQHNPQLCYKVLIFLFGKLSFNHLSTIPMLAEGGQLHDLKNLSLPEKKDFIKPPAFINVPILHTGILACDQDGSLRNFLELNGIATLTAKRIVEKYIAEFVHGNGVNRDNTASLVRYLFQLYLQGEINKEDLRKLQTMYVFGQDNQLHPVRQLYLSSAYNPEHGLDKIFVGQTHLFVHPGYMEDPALFKEWNNFFAALGAQEECSLQIPKEVSVRELKTKNIWQLDVFLSYLKSKDHPTTDNRVFKKTSDHYHYRNFAFFPYLNLLSHPAFSNHFWSSINRQWKEFIERDKTCQFVSETGEKPLLNAKNKMSYLRFILNKYALIRGTDSKPYTISQLFSPSLRSKTIRAHIAADIDIELSDDLTEYLGFKTKIHPQRSYELLMLLRDSRDEFDLPFYTMLLRQFIQNYPQLEDQDKQSLLRRDWFFLAENNTWQPATVLRCFADENSILSLESEGWFKNVLPTDEMSALANIFNCPVETGLIQEDSIEGKQQSVEFYRFLLERLPLIAYVTAHELHKNTEGVVNLFVEKFMTLMVFQADRIQRPNLDEEIEINETFVCISGCCYHVGHWRDNEDEFVKHILNHFEIKGRARTAIRNILKKNTLEECLAKRKLKPSYATCQSLIAEHNLNAHFPTLIHKPQEVTTTIGSTSSAEVTPSMIDRHPQSQFPPSPTFALPQMFAGLTMNSSPPATPPHVTTGQLLSPLSTPPFNLGISPTPKMGASPSGWSPIPVQNVDLFNARISPETASTSTTTFLNTVPPTSPSHVQSASKPRNSYKTDKIENRKLIGRWGEQLIFNELLLHYHNKYHCTEPLPDPSLILSDTFMMNGSHKTAKKINITLKWLNFQSESHQPFDLELVKSIEGELPKHRFVEVKATTGNTIHFFLSENEWKLMKTRPDEYRLYHVLNAGQPTTKILPIRNLSADIDSRKYAIQEHSTISYEINPISSVMD